MSRRAALQRAWKQVERIGGPLKDRFDHRIVFPSLAGVARGRGGAAATRPPHAVVIPSQRPGSLGDQAMVVSIVEQLADAGFRVTLAEYDDAVTWKETVSVDHSLSLARLFHLSDRVHPLAYADLVTYARSLRTATHAFVVGADVLDGHYSESRSVKRWFLAQLAVKAGVDARVINFSFNAAPQPRATAAAVAATASAPPRLFARDQITGERIGSLTGQQATVHADVAFNLKPKRTSVVEGAAAWVAEQRALGRAVVGVNVNPQTFEHVIEGDAVALVRELTARTLRETDEALDGEVAWLFIPHDWRPPITEEELAKQTVADLPAEVADRTFVPAGPYSAMEAKALASECDVVLTGRMHLAIASLGVGTPPLCLPYQGKFEGLMRHFGLPQLVLDLQTCLEDRTFSGPLIAVLRDRPAISATLDAHLEAIRTSARIPLAR